MFFSQWVRADFWQQSLIVLGLLVALAAILFAARYLFKQAARRITIRAKRQAAFTDTVFPDSKFVTVQGFNIRYVQRGRSQSPALVLIHGFSGYIYSWRHILDELAKDFHVIALDLPGFGRSDKLLEVEYGLDQQTERILSFLDHLKVKKFHLVGHSMGGSISAWIAKRHPERVQKLVLIAPAVGPSLVWFNPNYLKWSVPFLRKRLVTPSHFRRVYMHVSAVRESGHENVDEILAQYFSPYELDERTAESSFKHLHLLRDTRLRRELRDLPCPTLVIGGDKDPVISPARLRAFLKDNPQASLVTEPRSGHLVAEECPDFVIAQMKRFLTS